MMIDATDLIKKLLDFPLDVPILIAVDGIYKKINVIDFVYTEADEFLVLVAGDDVEQRKSAGELLASLNHDELEKSALKIRESRESRQTTDAEGRN